MWRKESPVCSDLWFVCTLVEGLEEWCLSFELDFFVEVVRHSPASVVRTICLWCNLIEDHGAPNIALLQVVKALVPLASEIIDSFYASHLVVLPPVVSELKL